MHNTSSPLRTFFVDGVAHTAKECCDLAVSLANPGAQLVKGSVTIAYAVDLLERMGHAVDVALTPSHVVGIDNGLSGGIVILSTFTGEIIAKTVMPIKQRNGKNEVDVARLRDWLLGTLHGNLLNARYFVEEPVGSKSLNAAKSMAASFHSIRGMLETRGLDWRGVPARTWQKVMLGRTDKNTKEVAIQMAVLKWPDEEWMRTDRCKVPHDGLTDAALIAEWARTNAMCYDHGRQRRFTAPRKLGNMGR